MANTGLGSQLGLKKETVWSTAVTVDKFFKYENESFNIAPDYVDPVGLQAGITVAPQSLTKQTTRKANGSFSAYAPFRQTGHLLDQMVPGTITPVQQGATAAYLSTFNVGTGGPPSKSATIQINKPSTNGGDNPYTYPGSVLTSAEFSMETGGVLMSQWGWVCQDETTPATTPAGAALASASYAANDDVWTHKDTTLLSYAGSGVSGVTGVNLAWSLPLADSRLFLGTSGTIAKPIPINVASITGTLSGEFYDNTLYAAFRAGTFATLIITFEGPTAIASTYKPMLRFTMTGVQLRGTSPQVGGPDLLGQNVPFVAKYDGTNPPLKIEYISTETAAW